MLTYRHRIENVTETIEGERERKGEKEEERESERDVNVIC